MSWITVLWPMMAAACITLALMQLLVWARMPTRTAPLLFAIAALGVAAIAGFELGMMRAETPGEFGTLQRWFHLPGFVVFVSLVFFVKVYFGAGRPWLAWTACGMRLVVLIMNFLSDVSVNYSEITALRHVPLWGETVSVAEGVVNPWSRLGTLSLVALLVFVADAAIAAWQRGGAARRRAALIGASIALVVALSGVRSFLIHEGFLPAPYLVSAIFMIVILAMAYELGADIHGAAKLADDLRVSDAHLDESERRMKLAADAVELGIFEWTVSRDELWATDKARALFGFEPGQPVSFAGVMERVHPEDREGVRRALARSLKGGSDYEGEFRVVHRGGVVNWIAARGRVERDQAGKPVLMRGVSFDVTERRKLELDSIELREELVHLSRVAMLGELSGSLAHELNQPLAAILSNAQAAQRFLAQDAVNLAELKEILGDIVEDDKRAGEVIRRLRTLLKKEEAQFDALDVNELAQEVLKLMRSDLLNRGVAVSTNLAPELPPVRGDRIQLQQVLLNLLINACDAMDHGARADRQIVVRSAPAGSVVEVSVADRGRGIPPGEMERVFEPFVTTKSQGLGLGLAVCRTIVAAHGGRIWASNNAGGGATIHFTLPA